MGLIRFLLAISVVVSHNGIRAPGIEGHLAVMAFFIISGFYMALVLNEKYVGNTSGFYLARILRLWPSYISVFILVVIFVAPIDPSIYRNFWGAMLVYFSSISMLFSQILWWFGIDSTDHLVFLNQQAQSLNIQPLTNAAHMQHMWSVGVEICFYLVAPLFARSWRVTALLLAIFIIVYITIKNALFFHHPLDHRSALNSFWLFLMGMISYWLWFSLRKKLISFDVSWWVASVSGCVIILFLISIVQHYFNNPYINIICFSLFACSVALVFDFTKNSRLDRFIGELSYPIYLTHWPIVAYLITNHRGSWMWSLIIICISVLCSLILYVLIDKNVEKYRRKLSNSETSESTI